MKFRQPPTSEVIIRLADFSNSPNYKFREAGTESAEAFRDEILLPAVEDANRSDKKVIVTLDGIVGCSAAFLHEVFSKIGIISGIDLKTNGILAVATSEIRLRHHALLANRYMTQSMAI